MEIIYFIAGMLVGYGIAIVLLIRNSKKITEEIKRRVNED